MNRAGQAQAVGDRFVLLYELSVGRVSSVP